MRCRVALFSEAITNACRINSPNMEGRRVLQQLLHVPYSTSLPSCGEGSLRALLLLAGGNLLLGIDLQYQGGVLE